MTFEDAVRVAPAPVCDAYKPGKQAVKGEHRDQVNCADSRRFTGSIYLEESLLAMSMRAATNPWDYGLGFRDRDDREIAIWIEVHPASTAEVSAVLRKLEWLRSWLRQQAPALNAMSWGRSDGHFFWLATAGVHIQANSPQARRLRQVGLDMPRRRLELR